MCGKWYGGRAGAVGMGVAIAQIVKLKLTKLKIRFKVKSHKLKEIS